jgi:NitT/TauT family transport system substrate-binding protein
MLHVTALNKNELSIVPATVDSHYQMMIDKQVDAVITFEPTASRLEAEGYRRIFDSKQIPGKIVDVLVTRKDIIEKQQSHIELLVNSHWQALDYLKQYPVEASTLMAPRLQISAEQLLRAYQGLSLPKKISNQLLLSDTLQDTALELETVMINEGLLNYRHELKTLFSGQFVQ